MFKIGEFSVLSSISIHMLRNYDKIGLLRPKHIDKLTGYRYYSEEQLPIANRIVALKEMGFGLKEICTMQLENMQRDKLKRILQNKIVAKEQEIKQRKRQLFQMKNALNDLEKKGHFAFSIVTKSVLSRKVASFRRKIEEFSQEGFLWKTLGEECAKLNVEFADKDYAIAIQHEINFDKNYIDVEVQRTVEKVMKESDKIKFFDVSSCDVASLAFQGEYCRLKDINLYLGKWIIQNGFEIYGPAFNIYYVSPEHEKNENKFITEVCFPIRKRK